MEEDIVQPKKVISYIYDDFDGHYMKLAEVRDLIPRFKDYYYERKLESPKLSSSKIINDFNALIRPERFQPYVLQYARWRKMWDTDIQGKMLGMKIALKDPQIIAVKVRNENNEMLVPSEHELESGAKTLGGELMNDAMTMLRNDQTHEDWYEDEVLMKRRAYVLNVFNFVMRAVNAKESLAIKKQQEKRETASFLMDLIRRSTTGKITPDEISLMKNSLKHNDNPVG